MESPEQWVFAYQHNVFDAGNLDNVDGHNHYSMVVDNCFGNAVAHYLQRLVAQVLDMIAGITVGHQYCLSNQGLYIQCN